MAVNPVSISSTPVSQSNKLPRRRIQDELIASTKKPLPEPAKDSEEATKVSLSYTKKRVSIQQQLLRDGAISPPLSPPPPKPETLSTEGKDTQSVEGKSQPVKKPRKTIQQEIIDSQKKTDTVA